MGDERALDRAEGLIMLGRGAEAEELARQHLAQSPESGRGLRVLARALVSQERWADAQGPCQELVRRDPSDASAFWWLTHVHLGLGNGAAARHAAAQSTQLAPHDATSWYCLALAEPYLADRLRAANEAVRLDPHDPDHHNLCGMILDDMNLVDEARRAYEAALQLDPQHAPTLNNLAALDLSQFKLRRAAHGLRSSLSFDPQSRVAQGNLDQVMIRMCWRVLLASFVIALVLFAMLIGSVWWPVRASCGAVMLGAVALWARTFTRQLPGGIRALGWSLFRRVSWNARRILFLTWFVLLCATAMTLLPAQPAEWTAIAMFAMLRVVLVLMVIWFFARAVTAVFRRE